MTSFRKKLFIQGSIAFVAVAVLLVGIGIFMGDVTKYGDEVVNARKELGLRSGTLSLLARLQSQYSQKAKGYTAILNSVIPREADLFNVSRDFQILATQSGVTHTFAFTGETPANEDNLGTINFRVQAEGNLPNLQSFIRSLEQFRYITRLESMGIGKTKDGVNTASLRGVIYFRNAEL